MKYKPRHPVRNFVFAILSFLGGLLLMLLGLSDVESPRIWEGNSGNLRSTTGYGVFWGILWMLMGAFGIYHHLRYFQERKNKKHTNGKNNDRAATKR